MQRIPASVTSQRLAASLRCGKQPAFADEHCSAAVVIPCPNVGVAVHPRNGQSWLPSWPWVSGNILGIDAVNGHAASPPRDGRAVRSPSVRDTPGTESVCRRAVAGTRSRVIWDRPRHICRCSLAALTAPLPTMDAALLVTTVASVAADEHATREKRDQRKPLLLSYLQRLRSINGTARFHKELILFQSVGRY